MRRKALLALAFSGNLVCSPLLAQGEDHPPGTIDLVVQQISTNAEIAPEMKVRTFLVIALQALQGETEARLINTFSPFIGMKHSHREVRRESLEAGIGQLTQKATEQLKADLGHQSHDNKDIATANLATQKAVDILDTCKDEFLKPNYYFIAANIFRKTGNTEAMIKCTNLVDDCIKASENKKEELNDNRIRASFLLLNSMAYALLPVPEETISMPAEAAACYSEEIFKKSENLKLRALAIIDQLAPSNHARRKGHRDMVLWYIACRKYVQASEQKLILFNLVGVSDDRILYPVQAACGHVIWWSLAKPNFDEMCGMG